MATSSTAQRITSLLALDQDRLRGVLENDVVLRVASAELVLDLGVEVVFLVLRLPIAERHAQRVEQRAIHIAAIFRGRGNFVLGHEYQVVLPRPTFEQVFESFAYYRFAVGAGDLTEILQIIEVLLDE